MKRLFLAAILVFPVATLVYWFYWGSSQARITSTLPVVTNSVTETNATTNLPVPAPAKP
jgi:hypothetical protein